MDFSALNFLDYAVLAIVFVSMLFAFIRGFIGSVLSFTGWILAIYLSYALFPEVSPLIEKKLKNPLFVVVAGHSGLLICFLIIFGLFNLFATNAVKNLTKGAADRLLGTGFGLIRGTVIVSFFYIMLTTGINIIHGTRNNDNEAGDEKGLPIWLTKAQTYPYLKQGKAVLNEFIPTSFYQRIQVVYDDFSKKSMNERFTDTMSQKLMEQLTPEQKKSIEDSLDEASLSKSQKEIDTMKVERLIDEYKKTHEEGKGAISSDELKQLEDKLKKTSASNQPDKTVELHIEKEQTE